MSKSPSTLPSLNLCFSRFPCMKGECNFWDVERKECLLKLAAISLINNAAPVITTVDEVATKITEKKTPRQRKTSK